MNKITVGLVCVGTVCGAWAAPDNAPNKIDTEISTDSIKSMKAETVSDIDGWYMSIGTSIYNTTSIKMDVVGIVATDKYRDGFSGYNIRVGYDWDCASAGLQFMAYDVDGVRVQNLTLRGEINIFPLENMPYLLMEYGVAQLNYDDVHEMGPLFGIGTGVRVDFGGNYFFDATAIFRTMRFRFDVLEIPVKLDANRFDLMFNVGYRFRGV